jgi:hypothetical protein
LSPLRNGDVFVIGWSKSGSRRLQVRPRNPFSFTRFHYRVYALGRGDWIPPIQDWGAHASRGVSRVTVRRLAGQPCARSVTTRCCLRDDRLTTGRQFGLGLDTYARRGRRAPHPGDGCAPLLPRFGRRPLFWKCFLREVRFPTMPPDRRFEPSGGDRLTESSVTI